MREEAIASLRRLVGDQATFHDDQFEAVHALVEGKRVLVVQRTGWGKSAVYFIACDLLRRRGRGPVLVLSPLLVLMRNQIDAASRLGLRAVTVNSSQDRDERQNALESVVDADLLFVTPESLQAAWFSRDVLSRIADPSAVVVDEVHCISEWGHNFRPKYRRIKEFLAQLPTSVGVLGATATATQRTVDDIIEQLGSDLVSVRGPLARSSLRLHVVPPADQPWRLAYLARFVQAQQGAGIVYVLTIHDAERVARWLVSMGVDATPYTGQMEDRDRREVERRLAANEVEAVVATTALGMGYDKPDLTWVVHYQTPAGPVSYYQQVGRAGRGVPHALGVMLQGVDDHQVHDWFIRTAYPSEEMVREILAALDESDRGLSETEILSRINIQNGRLQSALVILVDDGVVAREGNRYHRTVKPHVYPRQRVEGVEQSRRREFEELVQYARGEQCLMQLLQVALDDPSAQPCGRCGPCTGVVLPFDPEPDQVQRARDFLWEKAGVLEPRKRWPGGVGGLPMSGSIPEDRRHEEGRILGRFQDGGFGDEALRSRQDGTVSPKVMEGLREILDEWGPEPTWVTWVPSKKYDPFLDRMGHALAEMLGIPCLPVLTKSATAVPQQSMHNSQQAAANAWRNLRMDKVRLPAGPVLLVDDVVNSRWTITVAAHMLRAAGSGEVHPLVLCELPRSSE